MTPNLFRGGREGGKTDLVESVFDWVGVFVFLWGFWFFTGLACEMHGHEIKLGFK